MGIAIGGSSGTVNSSHILRNTIINLYKYKAIGISYYQGNSESSGKDGVFWIDGVYVRDWSGGSGDNATLALAYGGGVFANPKVLKIEKFETNCDTRFLEWSGYEGTVIDSQIRSINTTRPIYNNNYTATVAPGVDNDSTEGYGYGSKWYDTVGTVLYECVDPSNGAAVWVSIG